MARQAVAVLAASNTSESDRKAKERLWTGPLTSQELHALTQAHPDTLFLHYNVGRDGLMLLAFGDKMPVRSFFLGDVVPTLMSQLNAWLTNLTLRGRTPDEESLARILGKSLLQPLYTSGILSVKNQPARWRRLVLVPDGGLYNLPFAALILPEPGTHRLVERLPFAVTLSLRQLVRPLPSRKPKGSMLVVSDPTGDTPPSAHKSTPSPLSDLPLADYRALVPQLTKYFPNAKRLVGFQANKANVLGQIPDYALLVFATHGHLDASRSGLSSYLTLAPEPGGKGSGRLEASEILTKPLSARLTLLIACETAQGRLSGGEGNQGLVWAFMAAGCPEVVASLWKVRTDSTSELLAAFLHEQQTFPKDVALQRAILRVRSKFGWPGDWAAFQVYGAPSPLPASIPTSSGGH